ATVGAALGFLRLEGQSVLELVPTLWRWAVGTASGNKTWFAELPLVGDTAELPPALAGQVILAVDAAEHGIRAGSGHVAVVHDRAGGTFAVSVRVSGRQFALAEAGEQDRLVQLWGDALAVFSRGRTAVANVRWSEWAAPAGMEEQYSYLAEHGADDADPAALASYRALLGNAGPLATRHEVLVTLTVASKAVNVAQRHHGDRTAAAVEVGPALFFSLMIITLSFIPIFTLQAQEGRLFSPLAFTKTYAMAGAAALSVTLIPVLMGYWIRGRIPAETANPLNRLLIAGYRPVIDWVMHRPRTTLVLAALVFATSAWPISRLGGEFMPTLKEGDLLYMPSALPGLSAQKASELLQITDRLIKTVPEVETVFGKAGRAETATDPAPLEMFETTVKLKPREEWRPGMTEEKIIEELDRIVKVPGLANVWVPPIRNRIDMLATGIKSPIGVKVSGSDLGQIDGVAREIEAVAKTVPGVSSAFSERLSGGRYIDVSIDRPMAGRYGLNIADVQSIVSSAIGGDNVGQVVEGLARYPINVRYPREVRDSLEELRALPVLTPSGQQITLDTVAELRVTDGPPMLRSENGRLAGWIYVDVRGRDLASVAGDLREAVAENVKLPPGVSLAYSGQFEFMERAMARLKIVVPATLLIIFLLLYLTFGRLDEAALIMLSLPFALTGGVWILYLLGYNLSVATGVGFIALAGVAAEFGVIMLIYLKHALADREAAGVPLTPEVVDQAIREGAVLRVRPKAMTVAVIIAGLLPIMTGGGAGSEVMSRIAAPMLGGMLSAPLLSMLVVPAAYLLMRRRTKSATARTSAAQPVPSLGEVR
ncbi:MAG: CusA/CzcA family heavy metal efflux RND transporter, partial [Proteobacteria bacterium]|nr:CusA/CzcA family heavy metal efflux RND transporter [Pseudomonadota bacterium]